MIPAPAPLLPGPEAPLALSLALADGLLARAATRGAAGVAQSLAAGDALFVDLPGLGGAGAAQLDARSAEILAALYFAAEAEETYLPAVAEELTRHRFGLNLTDRGAAQALEGLAVAMRGDWIGRELRNQIFARVFGLGEADPNLGDRIINQEFEPRFARFCAAVAGAARALSDGFAPAGAAMRLAVAAQALAGNLDGRVQGNTLIVAGRLSEQLRLSITALNHPGMAALFMGRSAWDVVRGVLGPDTPDLGARITRAQTGLRLMTWLARNLRVLQGTDAQGIIDAVMAEPGLAGWAEFWLDASNIARGRSEEVR